MARPPRRRQRNPPTSISHVRRLEPIPEGFIPPGDVATAGDSPGRPPAAPPRRPRPVHRIRRLQRERDQASHSRRPRAVNHGVTQASTRPRRRPRQNGQQSTSLETPHDTSETRSLADSTQPPPSSQPDQPSSVQGHPSSSRLQQPFAQAQPELATSQSPADGSLAPSAVGPPRTSPDPTTPTGLQHDDHVQASPEESYDVDDMSSTPTQPYRVSQPDLPRPETIGWPPPVIQPRPRKEYLVMSGASQIPMAMSVALHLEGQRSFMTPRAAKALGQAIEPLPPTHRRSHLTLVGEVMVTDFVRNIYLEPQLLSRLQGQYVNFFVLPFDWPEATVIVGKRLYDRLST